ncbi:hypothetical protein V8V75_14450, partial [Peribacillus frigoritolerans]|uniref:hypothetical protein n=1 Tax=Peribacillus frigoritolerans TaxID=450367 RepID=UPI00300A6569
PSLLDVSVSGVSASQFFGRSVAYFFHPLRMTGKNMKDILVLNRVWNKTSQPFFLLKHKVDWNGRYEYETPAGKA